MKILCAFLVALPLFGQTDILLPWVTQNPTFQTTLILNNYGGKTAEISLRAVRSATMTEEKTIELGPFASLQIAAGDMFPGLGPGSGYAVFIESDAPHIAAAAITSSTTTTSGDSPSQMNAIAIGDATTVLSFNYLPIISDGFSAPVVVNLGGGSATVTFRGFQDGQEVAVFEQNVDPGMVFAAQTSTLFPDAEGRLSIVAESDQPLAGTAFIFNGLREPSMAAAEPIEALPDL